MGHKMIKQLPLVDMETCEDCGCEYTTEDLRGAKVMLQLESDKNMHITLDNLKRYFGWSACCESDMEIPPPPTPPDNPVDIPPPPPPM